MEPTRADKLKALELETERLYLRPFHESDAETMFALNDDPEVLQYTGDVQFENIEAARSFLKNYPQYEQYAVGRLAVIEKSTQEILGWCGLKYYPDDDEYDIGYRFFKKYWGKGFATESALVVMRDGFQRLPIKRLVGRARTENEASINVFKKLHLQFVDYFEEHNQSWVLYAIKREDML